MLCTLAPYKYFLTRNKCWSKRDGGRITRSYERGALLNFVASLAVLFNARGQTLRSDMLDLTDMIR